MEIDDIDRAYLETLTVLYVEDDADERHRLAGFLKYRVGKVITAENGAAGLEAFRLHSPQIVITDIRMPEMDGTAMVKNIRGLNSVVSIMVVTAYDKSEYQQLANVAVDHYLAKPLNTNLLTAVLLNCARQSRINVQAQPAYWQSWLPVPDPGQVRVA